MGGACSTYRTYDKCTHVLIGKPEVIFRLHDANIIEVGFEKIWWMAWIGLIWLRIGTSGRVCKT
jgi:hypothetical protein